MESRGNLRVLTSPTQVGKVGKTPHLAWRLKMKSDGNARFLTSGRGGTGRRAGFRFQYRKMWGFESLRPHQTAANADGRAPKDYDFRKVALSRQSGGASCRESVCRDVEIWGG